MGARVGWLASRAIKEKRGDDAVRRAAGRSRPYSPDVWLSPSPFFHFFIYHDWPLLIE